MPPPARPARRDPASRRRRHIGALLAGAALLVAATSGLAWLGSAGGVRWLAARLAPPGAQVQLDGIDGSLWSSLRVRSLRLADAADTLRADDVTFVWSPRALWRGRLHVLRLAAARVELRRHRTPTAAASPPRSLRLPLRVDIDRVDIGELSLGHESGAARRLGRWNGELHYADARWRWRLQAASPWGDALADGTLSDSPPYSLSFSARISRLAHDASAHAELHGSGSLDALKLHGTLLAAAGEAQLDATVQPYAALPLADATLRAESIDPARFDPALPHAALDLRVVLAASSAARLRGRIDLTNRTPGPAARQLLPLRALHAELSGDAGSVELSAIDVDLGAAGRLRGHAQWRDGALSATLQADAIDAHALDARLRPTRLRGPLRVQLDGLRQRLELQLEQPGWTISADAARDGDAIALPRLDVRAADATLHADGRFELGASRAFTLNAQLHDVDPARFGSWPSARIRASLHADGALAERRARVALTLLGGSRWRGRALTGHVALLADGTRLRDVDAALAVGDDRVRVLGAFGAAADRLRWSIDAADLRQLDPGAAGSVHGHGEFSGGVQAARTTLQLKLHALRWQTLSVSRLDADGVLQLDPGATPRRPADALARLGGELTLNLDALHGRRGDASLSVSGASLRVHGRLRGALQLDGEIQGAKFARTPAASDSVTLDAASLRIDGSAATQRIALRARGSLSADHRTLPLQLQLRAAGGWHGDRWSGQVEQLDNRAAGAALQLLAPAALTLKPAPQASLQLDHASLRVGDGALDLTSVRVGDGVLTTRGTLRRLDSGPLLPLLGVPGDVLRSTLLLSGNWDVELGAQPRGQLLLQRDAGDLTLTTLAQPLPLAIEQLQLELQLHDGRLDGRGVLLSGLGSAQASAGVELQRRDGVWGVAADAPLRIDAGADLPQLDWAAPLLGPELRVRGRLRLALHGRGSLGHPQFTGRVDGSALDLAWLTQGLNLRDGVLAAHFDGDSLELDRCTLHGGPGTLQLSGAAQLRDGVVGAQLSAHAERLQVLDSPDRQLVLDGDARAVVADRLLTISGALRAVRADFTLLRRPGATLSDDVVVLGRKPPAPPPAPAPAALPTRVHVDGRLDFGDAFHVHGSGIDAMLTGSLHVHADDGGIVRANGTVNVERGVYTAYGQNLSITSGRVNFNGPLDDPGLNIDATRPGLPPGVVVGVHLGGTALHPQATLSSDPAMPDTDMLSWLTLGMPLAQAGTSDIGVLQTAAAALLGSSDSVPLQTRLAHAVGLDSIGVDNTTNAAGAQESLVTVSKRLSSKLKVGFSRGIDGAASIFSAQYELAHRLSLRTRAGTENSVDLFYTFEFD
jgi:translocation and assembly module TamB